MIATLGSAALRPAAWSAAALAIGYALWWIAPTLLELAGLGWTADLGQLCLVILALSLLGKLEVRLRDR